MCTKEGWRGPGAQAVYENLLVEAQALLSAETDWLANLANAAALIYSTLPDLNWAGFYLTKRGELVLGLFRVSRPVCVFRGAGVYAVRQPSGGRQS